MPVTEGAYTLGRESPCMWKPMWQEEADAEIQKLTPGTLDAGWKAKAPLSDIGVYEATNNFSCPRQGWLSNQCRV